VVVVSELLKPLDARLMRCYPVSSRINYVVNDDEECSRCVELAQTQRTSLLDNLARTKYEKTGSYFIFIFRRHTIVSESRPLPGLMSPRCSIALMVLRLADRGRIS